MTLQGNILFKPVFIIGVALILLFTTLGCVKVETTEPGDNFTFTTITGETKHLTDYRGGPIIIDFMGVACGPCQQELFVLYQIHQNYTNLTIVSIDVWTSQGETIQDIQRLKNDYHDQYNMTLDWTFALDDSQGTLGHRFGTTVPNLYLYTKQGNLYYTHLGYEDYTTLATQVDHIT